MDTPLIQLANQFYLKELVGILLFTFASSWAINTLWIRYGARALALKRPGTPDLEKRNAHVQSLLKPLDRKPGGKAACLVDL